MVSLFPVSAGVTGLGNPIGSRGQKGLHVVYSSAVSASKFSVKLEREVLIV